MNIAVKNSLSQVSNRKLSSITLSETINFTSPSPESGLVNTYKRFFQSSPGKYFFSISFCIILIIVSGVGNFTNLYNRLSAFDYIRSKQEPLREATEMINYSVKSLQNSLNSYILSPDTPGINAGMNARNSSETLDFYTNYYNLIHTISSAITTASLNDPLHLILVQLNQLAPELTRLFGLGEFIIRDKQHNYTLALGQLATFNQYCDEFISPITKNLITEQSDYTAQTLKKYSFPSYTSLGLSIIAIVSLIFLSIWFLWRSKRIINLSILITVWIMLCSVFWFYISATASSRDIKYIDDTVYNRLSTLNTLNSDLLSIEYLQFQLITNPYQHNKNFLFLEDKLSHAKSIIATHSNYYPQESKTQAIFSQIQDYFRMTDNFIDQHNHKRTIITPQDMTYNFTVPQHIFNQSNEIAKSIEQRIVSQITKAKSRYNYIVPFYYLLSILAIISLNYARITRMREYR